MIPRYTPLMFAAVLLLIAPTALADVMVGREVPADQRAPLGMIDHSPWTALLQKYVNEAGNVNYTAWKASAADSQALDDYLAHLSHGSFSPAPTKAEQLAFWINAYNAVTVKGILREYPTTSIRNHTSKFLGYNIWHHLLLQVGDDQYSLDTMEHKILRKLGEPRIHFAIVCASASCPKLRNEAYTPTELEQQLAANTREFFADNRNFRYEAATNSFYLSSILDWFQSDFGDSNGAALQSIAPYLPTEAARTAAEKGEGSIKFLEYDWSLNDQKTP